MQSGRIRTKSGDRYKPSAIRGRVPPRSPSGDRRKASGDVQRRRPARPTSFLGWPDPSTARNVLMPPGDLLPRDRRRRPAVNPTSHLHTGSQGPTRADASPEEATVDALPERDRALWALPPARAAAS
jgi:hypothetical protein